MPSLIGAFAAAEAGAFEIINVPDSVNAINLRAGIDVVPGQNGKVQLSTAPGADGIIRRIEVLAQKEGTNPNWALFALGNDSDTQIQRLLVAPVLPPAGLRALQPDLGSDRIAVLTVNAGIRPDRVADPEADVFEITLDPGATVTFVAELVERRSCPNSICGSRTPIATTSTPSPCSAASCSASPALRRCS